ncbi:DUF2964 family protein [Burkholderia alba]|uniref:DUF2964 family protein n=1 Tax=Burkholderia alba TaxID=2683677 RepID=UPI002B058948|nr:DUF2964 family protein [Burkholderia alba]
MVFAAIAVFVALFGLAGAVHGLLFDSHPGVVYSVVAIAAAVAAFVILLNPAGKEEG